MVSRLYPEFGFLRAGDGREIDFHRNAVLADGWNRLDLGARVAFAEELGDEGPAGEHRAGGARHAPEADRGR